MIYLDNPPQCGLSGQNYFMTRTNYMQTIMTATYSSVAIEAIKGGFTGAWERCIEKRLRHDVDNNHSEACEILESVGMDYMKAAHLITSSKIPESVVQ